MSGDSRLLNHKPIEIGGVSFSCDLFEVDDAGCAVDERWRPEVQSIRILSGGRPREIVISGKRYVAAIVPLGV